jgi:branched-chain amino acid transport system permease protein
MSKASVKIKRGRISIRMISVIVLFCLMMVLPFLVQKQYLLHLIILANILAVFALSWDLLAGFMGQLNLGHSMFFGIGAYAIGFITMAYRIPPALGLIFGGLISVLLSLIVGIPCLRLRGPYYAIATLAFSQVLFTLAMGLPKLTGSEEGITNIPKFIRSIEGNYYFSFFLLVAAVIALNLLFCSKFGKKLISLREDERLSEAAGIDTSTYKMIGAAMSAFLAGLMGAYNCYYLGNVTPDMLSISLTFSVVAVVVFGGIGTLYGAIPGAYILTFLNEYLYFIMDYRLLIYALVIILILLYSSGGILGLVRERLKVFGHGNTSSQ